MASVNVSASYVLIVDRLKKETINKAAKLGVMKNLVTLHTEKGGNDLAFPIFDRSASAGSASTVAEGAGAGTVNKVFPTQWKIGTPVKKVYITDLTDEAKNLYSSESLYGYHSDQHAWQQMIAMEKAVIGTFASFTSTLNATVASTGLTLAKLFDGVTALEAKAYELQRPYAFVGVPAVYNYLAKDMAQQGVSSNYGPVGAMADKVLANYFVSSPMPGTVDYYNTIPGALTASAKTVCGLFTKDAIKLWAPTMFEMATKRVEENATDQYFSRCYFVTRPFRKEAGVKVTALGT